MAMCGRFTLSVDKDELTAFLDAEFAIPAFPDLPYVPRYNIAPGQNILTVLSDGHKYRVGELKWGLVPAFATDLKVGYSMINAKAETLFEKPSFRPSTIKKRCVILADSFYEWKSEGTLKTPHRIVLNERKVFAMAGLWSTYQQPDGTKLFTCTIVTTTANALLSSLHERMPVILEADQLHEWLDPNRFEQERLQQILKPFDPKLMKLYPVSSLVNKVQNNHPDLIQSIETK
jgi:putative SOS response-associated peptidase YedK